MGCSPEACLSVGRAAEDAGADEPKDETNDPEDEDQTQHDPLSWRQRPSYLNHAEDGQGQADQKQDHDREYSGVSLTC